MRQLFFATLASAVAVLTVAVTIRAPRPQPAEPIAEAAPAEVAEVMVPNPITRVHVSTLLSPELFDAAYAAPESVNPLPESVRGLILPHHLIAAPLIAATLRELESRPPARVIIIGPDHLGRAAHPAIVTAGAWKTPYGILYPDRETISRLERSGLVVAEEAIFDLDHSVAALVPFVKRSFPDAKLVPLMVNQRLSDKRADMLAAALHPDAETLIIASVDFSHYQTDRVARFHDRTSRSALSAFSFDDLPALEIDSPESLHVLLSAMSGAGARATTLLANETSSGMTGNSDIPETTSYVLAAFRTGSDHSDDTVTILSVGDMMLERDVRTWSGEEWPGYPFAKIRGTEDRFFRGADIMVGNLEGAIAPRRSPEKQVDFAFESVVAPLLASIGFDAVNLANNHTLDQGRRGAEETASALGAARVGFFGDQVRDDIPSWKTVVRGRKIAFLGFNATDNPVDEGAAEAAVRAAAEENDIAIVNAHWGAEYQTRPTSAQRALGRKFIEWGASAVVGHHPHVVQGMEIWRGRPIFWSLGNFIFDQEFSTETKRGLALGLAIGSTTTTAYLFPTVSEKGQPSLSYGAEDRELLAAFADRSDIPNDMRAAARRGIIEMTISND